MESSRQSDSVIQPHPVVAVFWISLLFLPSTLGISPIFCDLFLCWSSARISGDLFDPVWCIFGRRILAPGRSSYTSSFMGSFFCLDTLRETTACLHEYCVSCEKSHVTTEACAYLNNKLGVSNVASICNENKIAIHEVDGTHALVLSINDPQGQLSVCDFCHLTSDENVLESKMTETHQDLCLPTDWNAKKQKALAKSATFPLPPVVDDSDLSMGGGARGLPSTEFENQCSSTKSKPTYERSISLPVPPELISAMKGSRAQHGSPSNLKLHVKWAPDVYDPPCTLLSHTVKKNHHKLSKSRKNYSKHRAKSTRGNNNDRTANRSLASYKIGSFNARLQTPRNSRLVSNEYGKPSTEGAAEYAVSNQDSKCGGSFLAEALAKVNISSVTEVT